MAPLAGKRILYVITKSNWGGAQVYVHTLATHAAAQGAQVAVAFGGTGRPGSETGLLAARLSQAGIRTIVVPSFARDISFGREWQTFKELRELFRNERPDILHLNSSKAGGIGALAARLSRIPRIIYTAHGWAHREQRPFVMRTFIWLSSFATIVLSHVVIVVSECDRRTAPVLFSKRKLHVVTIGVDAPRFLLQEDARHFLAPGIIPLQKLSRWIVILAELTRNKGIDTAIRAFAGVSTNMDNAALVIISEGEEHARLLELIKSYRLEKKIFLLGFVPDAKQYLTAADIFLLPSRKEGFPLTLLEAGHAALPVIASNVGGIPEIIEHERTGLLVRANDVDALADTMTRMLRDTEEACTYGQELQKSVREKFSEKAMLEQTIALYLA